jgi:hypothetical protein
MVVTLIFPKMQIINGKKYILARISMELGTVKEVCEIVGQEVRLVF